ncbi:hypothetical protein BDEG_21987 [Batrachochytrium dendrobatidis JEL423]|uniref:3-oxo-5-alpha-steroid 4-dehydrogenase C-terminal domain-containing protein n=1 Tax=Batrachochytrium dendrobatidis (strain JEL423) TaxID=403673 RepID=A0A177WD25_BATDL|nr:hypothetical protein BDEG_21987 [Batrachochytrium dendrobatidis JEL423]
MFQTEQQLYSAVILYQCVITLIVFVNLLYISAPYGKFGRPGFGRMIQGKLAWPIFESVPLYAFTVPCLWNGLELSSVQSIIFPLRAPSISPISIYVIFSGIAYNLTNGYLNGRWIGHFGAESLSHTQITDIRFCIGVAMFIFGMYVNITCDNILFDLRRSNSRREADHNITGGEEGTDIQSRGYYAIPLRGWFAFVSSPHYLGEIIEWTGFAIAAPSPASILMLVFSCVNMVTRALKCHQWYKNKFGDRYPRNRMAIIPGIL